MGKALKRNMSTGSSKKRSKRSKSQNVTSGQVPANNFVSRNISAVPQTMKDTLIWAYASTASVNFTYQEVGVIIGNGPYDPDSALGGASATGFAKLMAFYSKCFVLGFRIKVKVANVTTTANEVPMQTGLTVTTNVTSLGNISSAVCAGLCDYKLLFTSPSQTELKMSIDVGKFLNKPKVLDDPQLFNTSSGNPTQQVVGHFWCQTAATGQTCVAAYMIEVSMECVFTDPIPFS
jgi:hypothetical protein